MKIPDLERKLCGGGLRSPSSFLRDQAPASRTTLGSAVIPKYRGIWNQVPISKNVQAMDVCRLLVNPWEL